MTSITLPPLRVFTYLNDFAPRVHVVGLGCEASFGVRCSITPRPGYPDPGVHLSENHGFTHAQLDELRAAIVATYPELPSRTCSSLTPEQVEAACSEARSLSRDPGAAVAARYRAEIPRLEVTFSPSETKLYDLGEFWELAEAAHDDLAEVEVSPAGTGILFPRLNLGLAAQMLYRDRLERSPSEWE